MLNCKQDDEVAVHVSTIAFFLTWFFNSGFIFWKLHATLTFFRDWCSWEAMSICLFYSVLLPLDLPYSRWIFWYFPVKLLSHHSHADNMLFGPDWRDLQAPPGPIGLYLSIFSFGSQGHQVFMSPKEEIAIVGPARYSSSWSDSDYFMEKTGDAV